MRQPTKVETVVIFGWIVLILGLLLFSQIKPKPEVTPPPGVFYLNGNIYGVHLFFADKIYREIDTTQTIKNIQHVLETSTSFTEILDAINALRDLTQNEFEFSRYDVREVVFMNRLNTYLPYICQASHTYNIEPNLIKAIIYVESNANVLAQSHKGAKGLMQLMDITAMEVGVLDVWDPQQNIMGGTAYLRAMLDRYNSIPLALAAYNAGPRAVQRFGGIPPYRETRNYVREVMRIKNYLDSWEQPYLFAYVYTGEE